MDSQTKFASLNLAIVLENGSVWDVSFDDKFMAIKKKLLIQLPKSKPYFPFSTNFKVLNFVRNDLSTKIIQLNNQGHMTIPASNGIKLIESATWSSPKWWLELGLKFRKGIQIGNIFWVFDAVAGKTYYKAKIFERNIIVGQFFRKSEF